jgi:DNA-binding MarR family transcriptional regulator
VTRQDSIEWARERWAAADFPDPDHFAAMAALMRVSQIMGTRLDAALRDHGMSRTAFLVLSTLQVAVDETLTMGQLSRRLILHPTTISLAVDQLQSQGFVAREPHPTDKRTILARLTPEGTKALRATTEAIREANYGLEGVPQRQAILLTEVIRSVREKLGDE